MSNADVTGIAKPLSAGKGSPPKEAGANASWAGREHLTDCRRKAESYVLQCRLMAWVNAYSGMYWPFYTSIPDAAA